MARPKILISLTCVLCGKQYERPKFEVDKAARRGHTDHYCSLACSQAHHAVKNAKPCATCGKPVKATGRTRNATYCSGTCKPSRVVLQRKTCPVCSVEFQPRNSKQVYCGVTCADTAHAIRMRGDGNSNYRTGNESAYLYDRMRPLILERDKGCVVCRTKVSLCCHHITENRNHNAPENLITLCKTHHQEHHKSSTTPFPWLGLVAKASTLSMTSKWKKQVASLQTKYLSATA